METIKLNLDILPKPHSKGQEEFLTYKGSIAGFAGRRWGKTLIACVRLITFGLEDPGLYWWVGLSWKSASMKRAWRTLKMFHKKIWLQVAEAKKLKKFRVEDYVKENEKELIFPNGFTIWLRTADNPDSLQGEGVKGIVIDEVAFMPEEVWSVYLEATTIDFGAWVVMISSPNGCNWFDDFWIKIRNGERKDWIAREYTTFENSKIMENPKAKAKLMEIIENTPPEIVAQVYEAKRLSTVNKCFDPAAVRDCIQRGRRELRWDYKTYYVASIDASGGGQNAYTLDISHKEIKNGQEILVQDVLLGRNYAHTKAVTKEYADKLKEYKLGIAKGDKYSAMWAVNEFLEQGIILEWSELDRSECYKEARNVINQRRAELLDVKELSPQMIAVESKLVGVQYKYVKNASVGDDYANVTCMSIAQLNALPSNLGKITTSQDKHVTTDAPKVLAKLGTSYENSKSVIDGLM